jgi:hypothetical protein
MPRTAFTSLKCLVSPCVSIMVMTLEWVAATF